MSIELNSKISSKQNEEKRYCYYMAGEFLEHANARRLNDDLSDFLYDILFANKIATLKVRKTLLTDT